MTEETDNIAETNDGVQTSDTGTGSGDADTGGAVENADSTDSAVQSTSTEPQGAPATDGGSSGRAGGNAGAQSEVRQPAGVDLDAELNAKELLADRLAAGLVTIEEYGKEVAKHDRAILKAQRELAKPAQQVQQVYQQQAEAANYWQNWGKGKDVAQLQFGKTVKADKAAQLFKQARDQVLANPRYQGRREIDAESIAYDRWMDLMDAESKKQPAPQRTATPQTRLSGDASVSQSGDGGGQRLTAKEKLERGMYNLT